jgi:hypothetical protein
MKTLPILAVAALASIALASGGIKITPKFEKDQKTKWKTELKMNVGDTEALLTGTIVGVTKSADGDAIKLSYDWENGKAIVGGEEMGVPFAPTDVTVNKAGELQEASGGIQGTDVVRTFLILFAHLPQAEIEKDGTWKATYPASTKMELAERKIEGKYQGEEEVSGKKAHKFNVKMVEGEFKTDTTYWATEEGRILKVKGEFDGLPVPIAGAIAKGTITADYTE